jgi:hypothetical protein
METSPSTCLLAKVSRLTAVYWRQWRFLPVFLGIALLLGCVPRPFQAAPWEDIRAQLGTVGVMGTEIDPAISFEGYARGRWSGAWRGAALSSLEWLEGWHCGEPACGALMLITLPPIAVGGGISGAIAAEPKHIIQASENEAREALATLQLQHSLLTQLVERAREDTPHAILLLPEADSGVQDDTAAAEPPVDTVLELALLQVGSRGPGVNDPVMLYMIVRARLQRIRNGLLLYEGKFASFSEQRKFTEWCADNSALLRHAYARGLEDLAGQIVDDLFLSLDTDNRYRWPWMLKHPSRPLFGGRKVNSLQPSLAWKAFPHSANHHWIQGRQIEDLTYELKIVRVEKPGFPEVVIERRGLQTPYYTVEFPLQANASFQWVVRSRFKLQGEVRVTPWSSPIAIRTPRKPKYPAKGE